MSWRLKLFSSDIQSVIDVCVSDPACPFKNFEHGNSCFSFVLDASGELTAYTFSTTEDYPENSALTCLRYPNTPEILHERIQVVFSKLAKEHWKALNLYVPELNSIQDKGGGDADTLNGQNLMVIDDEQPPCSPASVYTDGAYDTDDTDYDDMYYMDSEDNGYYCEEETDSSIHPLLSHDMDQVRKFYGPNAVNGRVFAELRDIDVELNIDVSFLEEEISKAWCINRHEPIVIRLHCSLTKYLDANVPKVEVFQSSKSGHSGICSQLRKIAEGMLLNQWKSVSNEKVQSQLKQATPSPSRSPARALSVEDQSVAKLVGLGFGVDDACSALRMSQGRVEDAASLLVTQPEICSSNVVTEINHKKPSKRLFPWQRSSSVNGQPVTPPGTEELHLIPAATQNGKNAKVLPVLEHGFMYQLFTYLRNRIPTLSEFCVVCDEQHIFQNGAMLKPAVCERELCVFSFQTLGVMQDAAANIATGAEVVDLMVAMVASSIRSSRRHLIFDPYPMVVDPRNSKEFAFTPRKKNYERIQQSLDSFITIREMLAAGSSSDVKKRMDGQDVLAYPLLQWIISSNRSHIVKLPEGKQIKFMHTPHQFLLLSSPPAKEAAFRKAKMLSGSTFAFHGSHIENWHSILRHGLINASGTKHQMHGAVYGKGIYLSPHSSVSFGYSGMGHGIFKQSKKLAGQEDAKTRHVREPAQSNCRFLQSKNLTCIALCEVVNTKELTKHGHVWVCTNPDLVCTRFFFVYEDGKVGDQAVDTTQEKYTREIITSMADC
ncbi:protein mono-ADP-ribosyltransferase PARP6-like isoform X1 [Asterias rubens]|uniref:protein mono-ADP-ribosyltransferase PARP6-like isoform X1 n=1 Tax=Asterias rubens TaxID=7604 RepID=UPI001455358A|nr:protein mono-ADP-ribosyltransferase PARP6-like isoform X1 [Asterias rubens]